METPQSGAKRRPHSHHQGLQQCRDREDEGTLGAARASAAVIHSHSARPWGTCDCSRPSSCPSSLARLADTTLTSPATVRSPPAMSPPRSSYYLAPAQAAHLLVPVYQPTLQPPTPSLEPHRSAISPSCPTSSAPGLRTRLRRGPWPWHTTPHSSDAVGVLSLSCCARDLHTHLGSFSLEKPHPWAHPSLLPLSSQQLSFQQTRTQSQY